MAQYQTAQCNSVQVMRSLRKTVTLSLLIVGVARGRIRLEDGRTVSPQSHLLLTPPSNVLLSPENQLAVISLISSDGFPRLEELLDCVNDTCPEAKIIISPKGEKETNGRRAEGRHGIVAGE